MRNYLSAAVAFIQDNGDEVEQARLQGLLGRARPEPKPARALLGRQLEDGGFPYGMIAGRPSAISATATALLWMQELHLWPGPQVERAAAFLLALQRPDGAWEERPAVIKFDPPPHLRPGHPAGRLHCTGLAAFWLTRLVGSSSEALRRAVAYLNAARPAGARDGVALSTAVLIAATLALVGGPKAPATVAEMAALAERPQEEWGSDPLADALLAFYAAGYTADEPLVAWALRRLLGQQRPDGGWTSAQGRDHDVEVSLRALHALLAFGVPASASAA